MKNVMSIAGFDGSGGAGLQADIKSFCSLGVHDISVVTSVTAQNSKGVFGKKDINFLKKQLDTIHKDVEIDAIKIGMLSNRKDIKTVKNFLKKCKVPTVLDTPFVSSSGYELVPKSDIKYLAEKLIPLSTVVTPNIAEAELLSGIKIDTLKKMKKGAEKIYKLYKPKAVLIKGGHLKGKKAVDLLYNGKNRYLYKEKRIKTGGNFHGTGCVFSSAIAVYLSKGHSIKEAVKNAKKYVTDSIKKSYLISKNGSKYLRGCKNADSSKR